MSLATVLLALFVTHGLPGFVPLSVELDRMSVAQAWGNSGRLVWSTFIISCPPDTHGDVTIIGSGNNEVERVAYVPKDLLLNKGHEVTVIGVLRVKVHPPAWVNGQFVKEWTEIWVEHAFVVIAPDLGSWFIVASNSDQKLDRRHQWTRTAGLGGQRQCPRSASSVAAIGAMHHLS